MSENTCEENNTEDILTGENNWDNGPINPYAPRGRTGKDGANGRDGTNGRDGADGERGRPGTPGKDSTIPGRDGWSPTPADLLALAAPVIATEISKAPTVVAAAAAAVNANPKIAEIESRAPTHSDVDNTLFVVADNSGGETWLGARASDGGPTDWAMRHVSERLGVAHQTSDAYLFAVTDGSRNMTDLSIRASDGQFADFVIDRLRARILGGKEGVTEQRLYADAPYVPGTDMYPVHTDSTRVASWGSSTMEGYDTRLAAHFEAKGASYYGGGKGAEYWENTAARMGVIPALVTVNGGTVPESGSVGITVSNMPLNKWLRAYPGTLAGIPGTLAYNITTAAYSFTRAAAGVAQTVNADTAFIPDAVSYRDAINILNLGKNNLGVVGSDENVIGLISTCFDWLVPLNKRVLVLGHFIDSNTPAVSRERDQINAVNEACRKRYGALYVDVQSYLTNVKLWADTGVTPTPEDIEAQKTLNKPPSVSADNGHLNAAGYSAVINHLIIPRLTSLNWH